MGLFGKKKTDYVRDALETYHHNVYEAAENQFEYSQWTGWYQWYGSLGDWNATTKTKAWSFTTAGEKEVWAEVRDSSGNPAQCHANIFTQSGHKGDFDSDGDIDILDFVLFAIAYGSELGDDNFNPVGDFDDDGDIDILDFVNFAGVYGT